MGEMGSPHMGKRGCWGFHLSDRLEAVLGGGLGTRDDERGGAVADPRSRSGGDDAALLEGGGQRCHLLWRRHPRVLIDREALGAFAARELDRRDLVIVAPLGVCIGPTRLRLERVRVRVGPADTKLLGEILRGDSHRAFGVRIGETYVERDGSCMGDNGVVSSGHVATKGSG